MKIDPGIVGAAVRGYETEVSWRQTTNYAAAVGDANPRYLDDTRADGLVAPPMFAAALTWPLASRPGTGIEGPDLPDALFRTRVHYSEHIEFHSLVRPGDRLRIAGTVAAVLPHHAGTHFVVRYEARDASGAPVYTEHSGAILRGIACAGPAGDGDAGRELPAAPEAPEPPTASDDGTPGASDDGAPEDGAAGPGALWEAAVPIDPLLPYLYDGCTDIVFPIHTSPAYAREVGLPGIILQGTAALALAAREMLDREAGGAPERLTALACRFGAMVAPGTTIRVRLVARAGADRFFEVLNEAGEKAVARGYARIERG